MAWWGREISILIEISVAEGKVTFCTTVFLLS